jgi:hypothetical protein
MKQLLFVLLALSASTSSSAVDKSLAVQLGGVLDLPDAVSSDHTRFGVGPSVAVMVRAQLTPFSRLRFGVQGHLATGSDKVTWEVEIDGSPVRMYDQDHFSLFAGVAGTVGLDVMVPGELAITPYFGGDVGALWVGTYHSFSGDTQPLLDPIQNNLENSGNVDPFTTQAVWLTEFHAGVEKTFGDRISAQLEAGYQMAYLGRAALKKTPEALDARREAYGWNALRLGLGFAVAF